jgi:hypothetical protein
MNYGFCELKNLIHAIEEIGSIANFIKKKMQKRIKLRPQKKLCDKLSNLTILNASNSVCFEFF